MPAILSPCTLSSFAVEISCDFMVNIMNPAQNGDLFQVTLFRERNIYILIKLQLKFVDKSQVDNKSTMI